MRKLKSSFNTKHSIVVCLSFTLVVASFLSMTVKAASASEKINSLSDIPAVLEDQDTPGLGSGKIYYRKANVNIADGTNTDNYQKALRTPFLDEQYKIDASKSSIVDDWEYLGACFSAEKTPDSVLSKYIKNMTVYENKTKEFPKKDGLYLIYSGGTYEEKDNSLENAQEKIINRINSSEFLSEKNAAKAKKIKELSDDTKEGPVYCRMLLSFQHFITFNSRGFKAVAIYFHNFKVSPIYPMNEGSYKQEISDVKEASPVYTSGFRNDSGRELSGTQSLTNSINYTASNLVSGSKSYTYEESSSVEYKKSLGVFGEITGTIGFNASQAIENGWSNEKSETSTKETTSEATITLPPYTAVYIRQQQKKQEAVTYYKCPVLISYDVTIAGYDTNSSSILGQFSGSNARASLKKRAVLHTTDTDKDGIKWSSIRNNSIADKAINRISQNVLMCSAGGSYTENLLTTESKVDELIATRPLVKVVADRVEQKMKVGESFSLNWIKLQGLNEKDVFYYGFQGKKGTWNVTDANGNIIVGSDAVINGGKGNQKLTISNEGTYYLTYFIDEDEYHTSDNLNHYAVNETVARPTVMFTVEKENTSNKPKNNKSDDTGNNAQQMKTITITAISDKIAPGKKITLKTNLPKGKVKWVSSNEKFARVNKNGIVKINKKAAGKKVIITAIATDGSGKRKTFVITIMKGEVRKVTIKGKKNVKTGKSLKLRVVIKADKGANKKICWISSNSKYATVTSSGKIKAKKAGKKKVVKITAMATDGSNKKATVKIQIK